MCGYHGVRKTFWIFSWRIRPPPSLLTTGSLTTGNVLGQISEESPELSHFDITTAVWKDLFYTLPPSLLLQNSQSTSSSHNPTDYLHQSCCTKLWVTERNEKTQNDRQRCTRTHKWDQNHTFLINIFSLGDNLPGSKAGLSILLILVTSTFMQPPYSLI